MKLIAANLCLLSENGDGTGSPISRSAPDDNGFSEMCICKQALDCSRLSTILNYKQTNKKNEIDLSEKKIEWERGKNKRLKKEKVQP